MNKILKKLTGTVVILSAIIAPNLIVLADSNTINFESPLYNLGSINNQNGWLATGPFDQSIVENTYGFANFGNQVLRISDAVTSGSFGDQVFAKPVVNAAGEVDSTDGSYSRAFYNLILKQNLK